MGPLLIHLSMTVCIKNTVYHSVDFVMEQLFGIALDCICVPNKVQVWYQWCKRFPCEMPTFQLNIQGLQHFRFLLIKKNILQLLQQYNGIIKKSFLKQHFYRTPSRKLNHKHLDRQMVQTHCEKPPTMPDNKFLGLYRASVTVNTAAPSGANRWPTT